MRWPASSCLSTATGADEVRPAEVEGALCLSLSLSLPPRGSGGRGVRPSVTAQRESRDLDTIFNPPPGRGLYGIKIHAGCLYPPDADTIFLS